jgi:formiminoglutamase
MRSRPRFQSSRGYCDEVTNIPHTTPPEYPADLPTSRLAGHVHQSLSIGCRVAILGLPDDLGVKLNGGRPGAKHGPRAFREAFSKYGAQHPADAAGAWTWPVVFDAGDVTPAPGDDSKALSATHDRVTAASRALVEAGLFPIAIGGGHDMTFAFVRGVCAALGPLSGIYFDAHLDVRESAGSGMPFRRLMEDCACGPLLVTGIDPFANAAAHVEYFASQGGVIHPHDSRRGGFSLRDSLRTERGTFVSFDLDCLDASSAPGVSAMNPNGLEVSYAAREVERLGSDARVCCFDIMELCPPHDEGGRTARVAVHLFLSFLRGFAQRPAKE